MIGQCIGRWGNFFNQEAFGDNTSLPWGMYSNQTYSYIAEHYTDGSVDPMLPVHPCFLYESLWCLLGFVLLNLLAKRRKFDGELFLIYIGWYGLGRFFIEGLRTDSLYLFNIRVSQLVAGTCVLVSIVLIIIFRSIAKRNETVLYVNTPESVKSLAGYTAKVKAKAEKKELLKKLNKAKDTGEGISDLKKEYEEKFGDRKKTEDYIDGMAKLIAEKADSEANKLEKQKDEEIKEDRNSILADGEEEPEENIVTDNQDKTQASEEE